MRRILILAAFATLSISLLSISFGQAAADVPLDGYFVARTACPALSSIRRETNPGDLRTAPNQVYPLLAKNKPAASHYLITIEGAEPVRRWVSVQCGEHVVAADGSSSTPANHTGEGNSASGNHTPSQGGSYVLAVSWQPAFCEGKPDKTECATQSANRFDATHFTLHGLWPQPRSNVFCHVSPDLVQADKNGDWQRLPAPALSPATRQNLERVMPGTMSNLERHEWVKHGTCYDGESADEYFSRAIALIDQLNASKARDLFSTNIGSAITGRAILDAFDETFGDGAGDRVRISCTRDGGRNLIVELTIGLAGEIGNNPSLADLIAASAPTDPGCPRGIVDAVGRQ